MERTALERLAVQRILCDGFGQGAHPATQVDEMDYWAIAQDSITLVDKWSPFTDVTKNDA